MAEEIKKKKERDRIGKVLYYLYFLFLLVSVVLIGQLIGVQFLFKPDPKITAELTPKVTKSIIAPARGSILARDGRLLAMSFPSYNIAIDPSVLKDEFAADEKEGRRREAEWMDKARRLADALPAFFPEKTADEYFEIIRKDRENGKRYRPIGHPVDSETLDELRKLPLFNEGQYKGGLIVRREDVRQYPYGKLARRTIGFIRTNTEASTNNHIGLEGKFDYKLHGTDGYEWLRISDGRAMVENFDSTSLKPVDGLDIRTTLDIDIQDIADKALREQIDTNRRIEGGCLVVMEVKTGAIRAMVNLKRDSETGRMEEYTNYAIGRAGEPGSVFKASTIMTLIEDGHVKSLSETIPTNHGREGKLPLDQHIYDYERQHGKNEISILEGLQMSSNYVFAHLAIQHYADKPKEFINHLYMYKLGEAFDFDLNGMATPTVPSPDREGWSTTDLGTTAYGYSVTETPLHILTFYNAIANRGKMMKPYLVEDIEKNGIVMEKRGPSILNASICKPATADTITAGLRKVVEVGTATRLKNARCAVAGKTGTARIVLDSLDSKTSAGRYTDEMGRKRNQATFVGFFPADREYYPDGPQYSVICVVYSILSGESFYGGTLPALAVRGVVDGICAIDPLLRPSDNTLKAKAGMPSMPAETLLAAQETNEETFIVPDLSGLGLKDALYIIENNGLRCEYSGVGHITKQSPKAGSKASKGSTVTITLK